MTAKTGNEPQWEGEREEGSTTPAVAASMGALLLLGAVLAGLMATQAVRVQVQAVADLAALAGSHSPSALMVVPPVADIPCGLAAQITAENEVSLRDCFVSEGDVWVVAARQIAPLGIPMTVSARARAGPVDGIDG